uniref:Uncharacterized protein n=1 Tax=Triticum urartu TaxID=4572 RepID=A0A8R7P1Z9_TRIUA
MEPNRFLQPNWHMILPSLQKQNHVVTKTQHQLPLHNRDQTDSWDMHQTSN